MMNMVGGLGSALLGKSDRRVKEDIVRIGETGQGLPALQVPLHRRARRPCGRHGAGRRAGAARRGDRDRRRQARRLRTGALMPGMHKMPGYQFGGLVAALGGGQQDGGIMPLSAITPQQIGQAENRLAQALARPASDWGGVIGNLAGGWSAKRQLDDLKEQRKAQTAETADRNKRLAAALAGGGDPRQVLTQFPGLVGKMDPQLHRQDVRPGGAGEAHALQGERTGSSIGAVPGVAIRCSRGRARSSAAAEGCRRHRSRRQGQAGNRSRIDAGQRRACSSAKTRRRRHARLDPRGIKKRDDVGLADRLRRDGDQERARLESIPEGERTPTQNRRLGSVEKRQDAFAQGREPRRSRSSTARRGDSRARGWLQRLSCGPASTAGPSGMRWTRVKRIRQRREHFKRARPRTPFAEPPQGKGREGVHLTTAAARWTSTT